MPIKSKKVVVSKKETTSKKPRKSPAKKPTKKVGRPTIIDNTKLQKLREAFLMDCTDDEACLYAEIAPATLYNYQNANPEFLDQKEHWKNNPEVGGSSPPIDTRKNQKTPRRCFLIFV